MFIVLKIKVTSVKKVHEFRSSFILLSNNDGKVHNTCIYGIKLFIISIRFEKEKIMFLAKCVLENLHVHLNPGGELFFYQYLL